MADRLSFRISEWATVDIEFSHKPTQEAIARLIRILEIQKDTFPTRAEALVERETIRVYIGFLIWALEIQHRGRLVANLALAGSLRKNQRGGRAR